MPLSLSPVVGRVVLAVSFATSLLAQSPAELVQALSDPRRRAAAVERLVEVGRQAIPPLRDFMASAAAERDRDAATQLAALMVLRRLGAEAAPVVPDVVALLNTATDEAVIVAGIRWLLQLVPSVEDLAGCRKIANSLRIGRVSARSISSVQTAERRLRAGPVPAAEILCSYLEEDDDPAAWRAAAIAVVDRPELATAEVVEAAEIRFAKVLQTPGGGSQWWAVGDLAQMLERYGVEVDRAQVTRGLLWHDSAETKCEALQRLRAGPAPESATVRDVVDLLDDGNAEVREFAANALEGWGLAALPGMPQLFRVAGAEGTSRRLRIVCERSAQRLLRDVRAAEASPAVVELLDRFSAFVHGQQVPTAALPADARATRILSGLAGGLLRTDAGIAFLDDTLRMAGGGTAELADSVLDALPLANAPQTMPMFCLLVRIGAPAAAIPDLEDRLARIVSANDNAYVGDAVEVLAVVTAGPTAPDAVIVAACGSGRPRLVLAGLAAAARRGLLGDERVKSAARAGAERREWGHQDLGDGYARKRCSRLLDDELRAACALALVGAGIDDLTVPIAEHFGLDADELPAWLAERRQPERLLATFVELEDEVRERMSVDEALRALVAPPQGR